jgi:uncharacterized membrane protein
MTRNAGATSGTCPARLRWTSIAFEERKSSWPRTSPLLATFLSLEAVLLTSCVLIRQNAIDRTSARRDHIELQINLLAEQEATRSLDVLQRIADHLKVPNVKYSQDEELAQDTAVDEIARDLRARERKESEAD